MIPLFIGAFLIEGISDWITLVIFASAAITDALDGYIARKKNIVTDFGKLMDPLADKIMVMSAFVCFTAAGILHPIITIVILAREFLITGLRSVATSKGKVIAADIWGKAKTVSQYAFIIVTLIRRSTSSPKVIPFPKAAASLGVPVMLCFAQRKLWTALPLQPSMPMTTMAKKLTEISTIS